MSEKEKPKKDGKAGSSRLQKVAQAVGEDAKAFFLPPPSFEEQREALRRQQHALEAKAEFEQLKREWFDAVDDDGEAGGDEDGAAGEEEEPGDQDEQGDQTDDLRSQSSTDSSPAASTASSDDSDDDCTMAAKTKAVMPVFSGEGESLVVAEALVTFLEKFDEYCDAAKVEENRKLATAAQCFKDGSEADVWYRGHRRVEQFADWNALRDRLVDRFGRGLTSDTLASQLVLLKQKDKESVRAYADRVVLFQAAVDSQQLAAARTPAEREAIKATAGGQQVMHFLVGLPEDMRSQVKLLMKTQQRQDWAAVRAFAEDLEDAKEDGKKSGIAGVANVGADGADEGGANVVNPGGGRGGGRGRGGGGDFRGGGRGGGRRAAWRDKPTQRPSWVRIGDLPQDTCAVCAHTGHFASTCTVPPERQNWAAVVAQIQQQAPAGRGRGGGGRGRGGGRGGGNGGGGGWPQGPPQQPPPPGYQQQQQGYPQPGYQQQQYGPPQPPASFPLGYGPQPGGTGYGPPPTMPFPQQPPPPPPGPPGGQQGGGAFLLQGSGWRDFQDFQ